MWEDYVSGRRDDNLAQPVSDTVHPILYLEGEMVEDEMGSITLSESLESATYLVFLGLVGA
jgi:hypothetical protein